MIGRFLDRMLLMMFRQDRVPGPRKKRIGSWMLRNVPGMLTCEELEDFVHDYYEGAVTERVRRRFDRHLLLCPMCRVHFASYVRAIELGQAVCEDELPEAMPEELVGAIRLALDGEGR